MRRFLGLALSAVLLSSACKVERTPAEYYSRREPAETERRMAEQEIRARVGALGEALERGDLGGGLLALAPASEIAVFGPEDSTLVAGVDGTAEVLRELMGEAPPAVRVEEVRVAFAPQARAAWFAALLQVERADTTGAAEAPLRMSGVYLRTRGEWRLVQTHLSRAATPPLPPQDSLPPDSTAREGA